MTTTIRSGAAAAAWITTCAAAIVSARGGEVRVIFSEIPGHPSSHVPGARDPSGALVITQWSSLLDLAVSPDGAHIAVRGTTTQPSTENEICMIIGGWGHDGVPPIVLQEGQLLPGSPSDVFDSFGDLSIGSFNGSGAFAVASRSKPGVLPAHRQVLRVGSNGTVQILHREGDAFPGLFDIPGNPSGDETIGIGIGSLLMLDNGQVQFGNTPIGNCSSARYPAVFRGTGAFLQSGVTTLTSLLGAQEIWDNFPTGSGGGTSDGLHWFWAGDTENPNLSIDGVFVVDGGCILQEGQLIPGTSRLFANIQRTQMLPDGSWLARGNDTLNDDFLMRDGVVLAATGQPIVQGSSELWGSSFFAMCGSLSGDWVLVGSTNAADPAANTVMVLNGERVILREGDPIDLDGNGEFDDDVFLAGFKIDSTGCDIIWMEDMWEICSLRAGSGTGLGDALLHIDLRRDVVIDEIFHAPNGGADGRSFIELFGTPTESLAGYELRVHAGMGPSCGQPSVVIPLPEDARIGSDGHYLIADSTLAGSTLVVAPPSHNGGLPDLLVSSLDAMAAPASIALVAPPGEILDVVGFGALQCNTDPLGNPLFEGTAAAAGGIGMTVARLGSGKDTNLNVLDFSVLPTPTPGAPTTSFAPNIPSLSFESNGLGAVSQLTYRNGPPNGLVATFLGFGNGPAIPIGGTAGSLLLSLPVFQLFVAPLDATGGISIPIAYPASGLGNYFVALQGITIPSGSGTPTWTSNITLTEGSCPCPFDTGTFATGVANYVDYQNKWEITISGSALCALLDPIHIGVVYVPVSGPEVLLNSFTYTGGPKTAWGIKTIGPGDKIQFRCYDEDPTGDFSTACTCYLGLLAQIEC